MPAPTEGEEVLASILLTRLPAGGGFMVRYELPGREALGPPGAVGAVAGCFAVGEDEALDLALSMIRCDRAALRARS